MPDPSLEIYAELPDRNSHVRRYIPHWYSRERCYKALERSGDGSNKDEKAIKVETLEELAKLIKRGLAVRMQPHDDHTSPARVAPENIVVRPKPE